MDTGLVWCGAPVSGLRTEEVQVGAGAGAAGHGHEQQDEHVTSRRRGG